jgi:hypothetical protein
MCQYKYKNTGMETWHLEIPSPEIEGVDQEKGT